MTLIRGLLDISSRRSLLIFVDGMTSDGVAQLCCPPRPTGLPVQSDPADFSLPHLCPGVVHWPWVCRLTVFFLGCHLELRSRDPGLQLTARTSRLHQRCNVARGFSVTRSQLLAVLGPFHTGVRHRGKEWRTSSCYRLHGFIVLYLRGPNSNSCLQARAWRLHNLTSISNYIYIRS